MKHVITIMSILLMPFGAMSQQNPTIRIDSDNGFIKACPNVALTFKAIVTTVTPTNAAEETVSVQYIWDFDNGYRRTTPEPTVKYTYEKGGAYMLSVTMQQDGYTATDVAKVIIGKSPDFSGYSNDINSS
ncbi:MAG: PKD domain-containing protein, partial [Bacteroidales bacterium]|nr:PKD domain-containing protein [Bacteroidales bacterium]